jgi:hypothetical protein
MRVESSVIEDCKRRAHAFIQRVQEAEEVTLPGWLGRKIAGYILFLEQRTVALESVSVDISGIEETTQAVEADAMSATHDTNHWETPVFDDQDLKRRQRECRERGEELEAWALEQLMRPGCRSRTLFNQPEP